MSTSSSNGRSKASTDDESLDTPVASRERARSRSRSVDRARNLRPSVTVESPTSLSSHSDTSTPPRVRRSFPALPYLLGRTRTSAPLTLGPPDASSVPSAGPTLIPPIPPITPIPPPIPPPVPPPIPPRPIPPRVPASPHSTRSPLQREAAVAPPVRRGPPEIGATTTTEPRPPYTQPPELSLQEPNFDIARLPARTVETLRSVDEALRNDVGLTPEQKIDFVKAVRVAVGDVRRLKLLLSARFMQYNPVTGSVAGKYGNIWAEGGYLSNLESAMRADPLVRKSVMAVLLRQQRETFQEWTQQAIQFAIDNSENRDLINDVDRALEEVGGIDGLQAQFQKRGSTAPSVSEWMGNIEFPAGPETLPQIMPWLQGRSLASKQKGMERRLLKASTLIALKSLLRKDGELSQLGRSVNSMMETLRNQCPPCRATVEEALALAKKRSNLLVKALDMAAAVHDDDDGLDGGREGVVDDDDDDDDEDKSTGSI